MRTRLASIILAASAVAAMSVAGCSDQPTSLPSEMTPSATNSTKLRSVPEQHRIPGQYIVVFKKDMAFNPSDVAMKMAGANGMRIGYIYEHALQGFSATIPDAQLADLLNDPRIDYIEPDQEMHIDAQTLDWGVNDIGGDSSSTRSGNGQDAVSDVEIYIIDTGIQKNHPDLNVVGGINYAGGGSNKYDDGHGHGTHCAGIAAARDNASYTVGVAPGAPLYAVRVLNNAGSGTTSGVIAGVNWVKNRKLNNMSMPMVANMSLGGGVSSSLDAAVNNLVAAGVVVCVAAGNSGADASTSSPARAASAITVGAVGSNHTIASWSNYGSVVDLMGPGVSIRSTYKGTTTAIMSGTSMAAPHVTGAAALYLSNNGGSTPAQVAAALIAASMPWANVGTRASTTTNYLQVGGF